MKFGLMEKTEGYAGEPNNWLSVRMEIRSVESLMTIEKAKSFANSITFKEVKKY